MRFPSVWFPLGNSPMGGMIANTRCPDLYLLRQVTCDNYASTNCIHYSCFRYHLLRFYDGAAPLRQSYISEEGYNHGLQWFFPFLFYHLTIFTARGALLAQSPTMEMKERHIERKQILASVPSRAPHRDFKCSLQEMGTNGRAQLNGNGAVGEPWQADTPFMNMQTQWMGGQTTNILVCVPWLI